MSGHTPGPWEWLGSNAIQGPDYAEVMETEVKCMAHCYGGIAEVTISEEDRRLMGTAPEMFDVLSTIENDAGQVPQWLWERIQAVLGKAGGTS